MSPCLHSREDIFNGMRAGFETKQPKSKANAFDD